MSYATVYCVAKGCNCSVETISRGDSADDILARIGWVMSSSWAQSYAWDGRCWCPDHVHIAEDWLYDNN